jgi:hypothetical protein
MENDKDACGATYIHSLSSHKNADTSTSARTTSQVDTELRIKIRAANRQLEPVYVQFAGGSILKAGSCICTSSSTSATNDLSIHFEWLAELVLVVCMRRISDWSGLKGRTNFECFYPSFARNICTMFCRYVTARVVT